MLEMRTFGSEMPNWKSVRIEFGKYYHDENGNIHKTQGLDVDIKIKLNPDHVSIDKVNEHVIRELGHAFEEMKELIQEGKL